MSSGILSKKITGLTRNANYVVRVYAKNAAGKGPISKTSNTVADPLTLSTQCGGETPITETK